MDFLPARALTEEVGKAEGVRAFLRETEMADFFHLIVSSDVKVAQEKGIIVSAGIDGLTVNAWKNVHLNGVDEVAARTILQESIREIQANASAALKASL